MSASRLICRLRHRQVGVLVTTSYVHAQAYQEIRKDGHPFAIVAGKDVVEIFKKVGTTPWPQTACACPYANICETCDNFITGPEFSDAIQNQLTDIQHLQADAETSGWDGEAARHTRVADALTGHLDRLVR